LKTRVCNALSDFCVAEEWVPATSAGMTNVGGDAKLLLIIRVEFMHCIIDSKDSLGEGCLWDVEGQTLWWLDIARPSWVHSFKPATGEHKTVVSPLLLTAIAKRSGGGFVVGGEDGVYALDAETGATTLISKPDSNLPENRMNDGACDAAGRFWIGSMMQNIGAKGEDLDITADTGKLFRVEADGASMIMERNVGVSNGPCWSPDGKTFYFSDSKNQVIYAYDFDKKSGDLSRRRVLNDTKDHGYPDGATVDAEGFIWSARWEGSCVLRIDPKGRIDRVVEVPATRVTCPVFGGADMNTLYVTTSRAHVSKEVLAKYPQQGGVFAFQPGVKGTPKHAFAG
jgi:sugar lactone lactonase YvrE